MDTDQQPLTLVAGFGRSGTSWVGKLLDSHPDTLYRHEPERDDPQFKKIPYLIGEEDIAQHRDTVREFATQLSRSVTPRSAFKTPLFRKNTESMPRDALRRGTTHLLRTLHRGTGIAITPRFLNPRRSDSLRMVWKSVDSLGRLNLILAAIPSIRVLLVIRHPCGVVASRIRGDQHGFTPLSQQSWRHDLMRDSIEGSLAKGLSVTPDELDSMPPWEVYTISWAIINSKAMREIAPLEASGRAKIICYEDLCADPPKVTSQILDLFGLSPSTQTDRFLARSTSTDDPRYYSVSKNPERTANAWRDQLSEEYQERIVELVRETAPGRLFFGSDTNRAPVVDTRAHDRAATKS